MTKIRKMKLWKKVAFSCIVILLALSFFGETYSRYFDSLINGSELPLAPWHITVNGEKVNSVGKINFIVDPVVTETTTISKTYKNKIVPGCKGYFDVEIDPTGTGVSIDYIIDFKPEGLPGGMKYTKIEILDENKNVVMSSTSIPDDAKIAGTMPLGDGDFLGSEDILRYRIYWDYVDDDELNVTAPDVDNQSSIMIDVILKQSI